MPPVTRRKQGLESALRAFALTMAVASAVAALLALLVVSLHAVGMLKLREVVFVMMSLIAVMAIISAGILFRLGARNLSSEDGLDRILPAAVALASAAAGVSIWTIELFRSGSWGRNQWALIAGSVALAAASIPLGRLINRLALSYSARAAERQKDRRGKAADPDEMPSAIGTNVRAGGTFLALTVFLTFLARHFLSDKNSYWLDELYSVERYVVQQETVVDAIRDLAATSIHPPLYQFILYFWIQLFGDGETATRTLSNLYVAVAIVATFLLAHRLFGRLVAIAATLGLALSYAAMYYGIETRSYAQSLMLATVSSLALVIYSDRLHLSWKGSGAVRPAWPTVVLSVANVGLLLTHYYNAFFWGAQAVFIGAFALLVPGQGRRLRSLLKVGALYLLQLAVFALAWGRVTLSSYFAVSEGTSDVAAAPPSAWAVLRSVTEQSFSFGPLSTALGLLVLTSILLWAGRGLVQRRGDASARMQITGLAYLGAITMLIPLVTYLSLEVVQLDQFRHRYVLFLVPGLAILIALAAATSVRAAITWTIDRLGSGRPSQVRPLSSALVVGMVLVMVLPGAIRAAAAEKHDWRGTAQDMVALAESNPDARYAIFEPSFRSTPMYNFYLRRYSSDVRVTGTIRRLEERRGHDFSFERAADVIAQYDYLIVPFAHFRPSHFPNALEALSTTYSVHHWQVDRARGGLLVFAVHRDD